MASISVPLQSPPFSCPDVGHVAIPHMVRFCDGELPGQKIRDFNMLTASAFVFMRRHLTAADTEFLHQSAGQPSPEFYALNAHHRGDTSGTSRTGAGVSDFTDETTFNRTVSIGFTLTDFLYYLVNNC